MEYERIITFPYDLMGRAAQKFVETISLAIFSSLYCEKDVRRVNAHSLLGLLSLGIRKGEEIKFISNKPETLDYLEEILHKEV